MSKAMTIPHAALEAAAIWPDVMGVIDNDKRLTFAELAQAMKQAAGAFVAAGLQPGERVAIWASNSLEWIVACLGLQAAGGVLVPLNTRFRGAEVDYILRRSNTVMAVAATEFLDTRYAEVIEGLAIPHMRRVIHIGADDPKGWDAFLAEATPASIAEGEARTAALTGDTVCDIMFTSGTTGDPKGVLATHAQVVETARLWAKATTLTAGDRFMVLWPFFHCSGYKAAWVVCLTVGAGIVPEATLDVPSLVDKVEREQVTFLPGPPTLFTTLLNAKEFDPKRVASIRVAVTGAASVAPSMITAMNEVLGIPTVLTGYGLTECNGTATMSKAGDPPETIVNSCGSAIDGIELKIIDADGNPLPPGEAGEVMIRGMNVMLGYLDDPKATEEAIDPDGWLHSGDIGILDEAGYLRITDRKKDIFIVGGFNCYPAEIEKMLLAHPAILQVAVTGIPDERMGEVGRAFVVLKPGTELDEKTLIAWSREHMANFKVPRSVIFSDELPTNATGKVQKFKLPA
ncbi:FadD3 family acyl-CoA ligase [Sphingomonas montanisoli]|nr:FadD3 family acyl-CoA ligase [Sphingomonas montanisoli]